jgi:hypothetical protein
MWDKATWQFINTFADWFAAAGTIAAVIVAIYLARLDKTIRLKVNAGARLMVTAGVEGRPSGIPVDCGNKRRA